MTCTESKRERSPHQPVGRWIRPAKRLAIYLRDGFACMYCGESLRGRPPADVTLDHVTPRMAGGTNEASNLITACKPCNSGRGAREWSEYATPGAAERILAHLHAPLNMPLAHALIAGTAGDPTSEALR